MGFMAGHGMPKEAARILQSLGSGVLAKLRNNHVIARLSMIYLIMTNRLFSIC